MTNSRADLARQRSRHGALHRVAAVMLIASLGGCGGFGEQKTAAAAYADRYFSTLADGTVEDVLPLYGAAFYAVTPRADWAGTLQEIRTRCGAPTKHTLASWRVTTRLGTRAGTTAQLQYTVEYRGCRMILQMTIDTPDGGQPAIVGHQLSPASKLPAPSPGAPAVEST